jgi:hypothetical protein
VALLLGAGGRAVQDVWIAPSREVRGAGDIGEWGTTLRFYDPDLGAWRSTWIGPEKRAVLPFVGRQVDDEIILEGTFEDDLLTRWIFSDITPSSFRWRAVDSSDGGTTWTLLQEMSASRA